MVEIRKLITMRETLFSELGVTARRGRSCAQSAWR
jgi:hypothetical protein